MLLFMPELPEVQTTVNGLQLLINKEITNIELYSRKLRYKIPKKLIKISKNTKILKIFRIAKYILLNLDNNYTIVIHLGMSGRLRVLDIQNYIPLKHDHVLFTIENNILLFNDPRKFGLIDFVKEENIYLSKYFFKLGLDPLDKNFTYSYFKPKINKSKTSIKQILLNQHIVSGIGNIYACEILFDAKISPFIEACKLNNNQIIKLMSSCKKILNKAIRSGGSSLKDYKSADGTLGNFQKNFKVYNKQDQNILGHKIRRKIQNGRSTFYCPGLQKKTSC